MFGLIFFKLQYNQKGVMDINGFIFLFMCSHGFSAMLFVINVRDTSCYISCFFLQQLF